MTETDDDPKPKKGVSVAKLKAISSDTIRTPKGNIVTKQEWMKAKDNGLEFPTHKDYADWVDGWAKPASAPIPATTEAKPKIVPSDKARGLSSSYYSSRDVAQSPSPANVKPSRY